ncbi:GNAT family N-acetyltransferase [Evansella cellulosilytica]|uniref:GCN5-related N-acetyltransferase n=1 Tax=Evansella cellulosilytica (strain ATCC 21833 / DSM 2522 / FERM P-1141 / JCM 9156 / N-4) TaxID=649639 RepID=E6TWF7_EVAC2|nr:GNAT family N-acetyltransferase [Evansella cellulosilytica]ADU32220.1 GCN5-related N-acetyltransferase [Evansella cellulosilytica DSM 2522]
MQEIRQVSLDQDKSKITNNILRELPEWFGIEEAITNYVNGVNGTDFYALYDLNQPVGFISIKANNTFTSEIYAMGISKNYHGCGWGTKLLKVAEEHLVKNDVKFFMVKTLSDSHPDKNYQKTRRFYAKNGFIPLEEIKEIWGEENPCLIMVKNLL